ncbi:hypothetical protein L1049_000781 [Liquidambar formosana]|uniref:Uncharacterized protein n=1 Tax=Liquidambar formosana TaxID=63359 RepID=A0AAP0N9E0_LIQFO
MADLRWVRPEHLHSMFEVDFRGFGWSNRAKVLWSSVILAILWVIWIERNARIFRDVYEDLDSIWDKVCFLASLWASVDKSFKDIPLFLIVRN